MTGHRYAFGCVLLVAAVVTAPLAAQEAAKPLDFSHLPSVYTRMVRPPEPPENVDWEGRVTALLQEQPGDVIVTAVGDLIFNQQISHLLRPERRQLLRILQEADVAYGNLEFSLNARPDLQRPFYNFRADPEFAWELAATGINLVSMSNNHALDFGPEGLAECLRALDHAAIGHAGAGLSLAAAREAETRKVQSQKLRFGLLSYMRYWTARYRCGDPSSACLATIDPAEILVAGADGAVTAVDGVLAADVAAMEDDVVLAKRHYGFVMVSLHNHDRSHHRAYGIQDTTPANDEIMYRRAVDAGADLVLGSGPHVLRGIELRAGTPIFYSLGNFVYQYRTPHAIPVDLVHQRDGEIARPPNVSVWDRRDTPETFQGVMARLTVNGERIRRVELIPFTIDREGSLYGVPRLADDARGREILELVRRLSEPYGTRIVSKGWYAEVELPATP
jgi:poly-gamma-glutamate synthesis protein (capsule biosynthesis protein)